MAQITYLSAYSKRVANALDYLQFALDRETEILAVREHSRQWNILRRAADAAWEDVLSMLARLAAEAGLKSDEARLAVLCDRIHRYLEGDDLDPTIWVLALSGAPPRKGPIDALIRRGVRLTNAYGRLLNMDAYAA